MTTHTDEEFSREYPAERQRPDQSLWRVVLVCRQDGHLWREIHLVEAFISGDASVKAAATRAGGAAFGLLEIEELLPPLFSVQETGRKNPWSHEAWSLTGQLREIEENPKLARQLAEAAGVDLETEWLSYSLDQLEQQKDGES